MSYIGNTPADKYQTLQKQSFVTSATDTYTLSYAVTNPQDLALFINNVRQNPNDAYTVSGTTLTLSSAITGSDTMYAVFLGRAVETVAPALSSVTNDMLAGSIATSKLADITANGITEADQWRVTTDFSGTNSSTLVSSNWERNDTLFDKVGTGMTQSGGVFTFPSTGIYLLTWIGYFKVTADMQYCGLQIKGTSNNSSYSLLSQNYQGVNYTGTGNVNTTVVSQATFDCQDTSNYKVGFYVDGANTNYSLGGASSAQLTGATMIRLGDT